VTNVINIYKGRSIKADLSVRYKHL